MCSPWKANSDVSSLVEIVHLCVEIRDAAQAVWHEVAATPVNASE
jgi:hypothetical protein